MDKNIWDEMQEKVSRLMVNKNEIKTNDLNDRISKLEVRVRDLLQTRCEQRNYIKKMQDKNRRMSRTIYRIRGFLNFSSRDLIRLKELIQIYWYKQSTSKGGSQVFLESSQKRKLRYILNEMDFRALSVIQSSMKQGKHLITIDENERKRLKYLLGKKGEYK